MSKAAGASLALRWTKIRPPLCLFTYDFVPIPLCGKNMNDDSAELTVRWFQEIENRLSDLLRIVSLDAHNSAAIFPQLTSVIIDSGSLVDMIFREEFASTHK